MAVSSNFIDPQVLAGVENLELRARFAVEGFLNGLHRSPNRGFSVEFTDYRHYQQGDDTRHIDWKLYGRSGKLYIKQYEDETNARATILLDTSASMGYGSGSLSKLEYARSLAAALAYFATRQRDAMGLVTFDERRRHVLPSQYRRGHLMQILRTLASLRPASGTDPARPLRDLAANLHRRGFIIVISDLLEGDEDSVKLLQQLRAMGHEVILFHVLDDAELNFPFESASEFVDMESEAALLASPGAIRDDYLAAFKEYRERVQWACQSHGVDYCLLNTAEPLDKALAAYLGRRGRQV